MNNLGDYFGELIKREGKPKIQLAARWARKEIRSIARCLRNAFVRCHFHEHPLVIGSNVTGQALGNHLADYFATQMDQNLIVFKIQKCAGQGYPDRRLLRAANQRSYALELKATRSYEPKSNHRVILTCSTRKLRRHFTAPINHLLVTIFHKKERNKVWIRNFRMDFLEPWTKVRVRLEAAVSQHLLAKSAHPSCWGVKLEPAKLVYRKRQPSRRNGTVRMGRRKRNVKSTMPQAKSPLSDVIPPTVDCVILPPRAATQPVAREASHAIKGPNKLPISLTGKDTPYLSKSDFKIARTCPAKLYYKKLRYPTILDDDPYMASLADGGFMVGKLAQMQYPEGVLVSTLDPWAAVDETKRLLENNRVTIFEAAIYHEHRLVRIDVLRKNGNDFDLIEVKSKAGDSNEFRAGTLFTAGKGGIRSEWRDYLEDVAYQAGVLRSAFPSAVVHCFLLTPDKAKTARLDGLCQRFRIRREGRSVEVDVVGNPADLAREDILTVFPVDAVVRTLALAVASATKQFMPRLLPKLKKLPAQIGYGCRNCQYRIENGVGK